MTIRFQPLGLPESSSYAVSCSVALSVGELPTTASLAEYSLGNVGPQGTPYKTVNGNIVNL
jgi:hypothetical protein